MDGLSIAKLIVGFVLLLMGGELLVRGASRLAAALGMSPLLIGLTVVAFGTSAPELGASIAAALEGQGDIALGNVVGSNIFNVLGILGLSAAIAPLAVARNLIRIEIPIMIAVSALVFVFGADGRIERIEGAILFFGFLAYSGFAVWQGKRDARAALQSASPTAKSDAERSSSPPIKATGAPRSRGFAVNALLIFVALALLVAGSKWLVEGATSAARALGVSELIIGLTVVAAGTSLPEAATSVLAALRGERDIAVGNVVGSNIFNILCVLGASGLISRTGIAVAEPALRFDIPVMIGVAVVCLPMAFTGSRINRLEGTVLVGYYVAYVVFLVLAAVKSPQLSTLANSMIFFVLPLTFIALGVGVVEQLKRRSRHG